MSNEITIRENNMAEMAYCNETPWHGLGQKIANDASIDQWREMAGLDWQIKRSTVLFRNGWMNGLGIFDDKQVLFRSDTLHPLSVVSKNYKVVQPGEVLEFFRDLVDKNGFQMDTAGSLKGGKLIWALARTGLSECVVKSDQVDNYLLLSTSCDGSIATTAMFTSVRVVCNNTLQCALSLDKSNAVRVRHNTIFNPDEVKENLGIYAKNSFNLFMDQMRMLSQTHMDSKKAQIVLNQVLDNASNTRDVSNTRGFRTIMQLFEGQGRGASMNGVSQTAWGLVNAVTEYADYHVTARNQDNRLSSAWFGNGALIKQKTLQTVLESVNC